MYDIIGDVHGYASLLKKLLLEMGYAKTENGFAHPNRKAIFVGDFVNRGPEIRKTIRIIRKMVENNNAYAILGNHEINAVTYYLKDKKGFQVIDSSQKNSLSLYRTISQFPAEKSEEWKSHLKWMRELPLFLDFGDIRIVHACWSEQAIEILKSAEQEGLSRKHIFRKAYSKPKSDIGKSITTLTKGIDFKMPSNIKIVNNKGVSVRSFRMRWWEDTENKTFEEVSFESKFRLPEYDIPKQLTPKLISYNEIEPIVFFGHYCRFAGPFIVKPNICCVDSCVTGTRNLTAYRWSGEKKLLEENLVTVRL